MGFVGVERALFVGVELPLLFVCEVATVREDLDAPEGDADGGETETSGRARVGTISCSPILSVENRVFPLLAAR